MRTFLMLAIVLIVAAFSSANAAVPQLINYQGVLTDSTGAGLDTTVSMVFTIYDDPSAGVSVWTETQPAVTVAAGQFAVLLGSINPILDTVFNQSNRYLGITVGIDPEISPRAQLVSFGYAHRVSTVDGSSGGSITSKVSIGPGHTNAGNHAFVAGENNAASGNHSTVSGGHDNTASGLESTVGGGHDNTASDHDVTISGGYNNSASRFGSTVSGGSHDTASGSYSTVGGGFDNTASKGYSTVGGGYNNTASGDLTALGGGSFNTASGAVATVAGGKQNSASGSYSAVSGGQDDTASGANSNIGGGSENTASGSNSNIGGGYNNTASGDFSTVGGGQSNVAGNNWATVSGGINNTSSGFISTVGGGFANTASDEHATVCGGFANTASGIRSTVSGGSFNNASGDYSVAMGSGAKSKHPGSIVIAASNIAVGLSADSVASGGNEQLVIRADGGLYLTNVGEAPAPYDPTKIITTRGGAYLSGNGTTWTNASDKNQKENFTDIDSEDLLEKISALPMSRWNYKDENETVTHIGPVAQDFYALFGVGSDDISISTIDPAGIALAAIKALNKDNKELNDRLEKLEKMIDELSKK